MLAVNGGVFVNVCIRHKIHKKLVVNARVLFFAEANILKIPR